jgi:hypothetical protein
VATANVLIQAGHEGRKVGATGAVGPLGKEIEWTPIVADAATERLRDAGFTVLRKSARLVGVDTVKIAIFIHFDGATPACGSKASIGFDDPSDKPAADAWRALYSEFWPFGFQKDNFTKNLSGYYGFKHTSTSDAELVLELGEITCLKQAEWLKPRLKWIGGLIAHFAAVRMGSNAIPKPKPFKP